MPPIADLLALMPFPDIHPIAFSIGPIDIRWYGIAYVVSITLGWLYARRIVTAPSLWRDGKSPISVTDLDDFVLWAAIGIVLGGRIGYVLFYDLPVYAANPLRALEIWNGGMSFHGGITGTTIAMILFARKRGLPVWSLFDVVSAVCVTGLFLVRIANFINGELWGKVTDLPWAVIFPGQDPFARHPSQLYEAGLEGLLTGLVLAWLVFRRGGLKTPGFVTGVFVSLYAASRILVEFVREPDAQLGYLLGDWLTMGMLLSVPMLLLGLWAIWRAKRATVSQA
ncbi:prolipoprotein diacylglyceryl transferase [Rhizobium alvei]|uniref:Phosphatidylglycerol--prolipoprotein diacylglyceryl transferase n=1 Tax=Rhizobium alvei TaxID=1132659 RepID=A0ABT8YLJ5_9HYPH|nr:prolipoprotein diacylglyceryl transferase [Rhizobium alvei]MDO6964208.1 prolipoprotein diacylglyceryl transferase [Rhizobium alvei]